MRLGVFGLGNMGSAMLQGAVRAGLVNDGNLYTYDPSPQAGRNLPGQRLNGADEVARATDVWLLAVKPYGVRPLLNELIVQERHRPSLVLSVAAGLPLSAMQVLSQEELPDTAFVRCMPNLAASQGAGLTAWKTSRALSDKQRAIVVDILHGSGGEIELDNEEWFHAFTGATGSGIAYLFLAAEAIADGAVAEGLPRPLAQKAAMAAIYGAGQVLYESTDSGAVWKDRVCSPGGTTIEGVAALEAHGARNAFIAAVRAAARRSRALSNDG